MSIRSAVRIPSGTVLLLLVALLLVLSGAALLAANSVRNVAAIEAGQDRFNTALARAAEAWKDRTGEDAMREPEAWPGQQDASPVSQRLVAEAIIADVPPQLHIRESDGHNTDRLRALSGVMTLYGGTHVFGDGDGGDGDGAVDGGEGDDAVEYNWILAAPSGPRSWFISSWRISQPAALLALGAGLGLAMLFSAAFRADRRHAADTVAACARTHETAPRDSGAGSVAPEAGSSADRHA